MSELLSGNVRMTALALGLAVGASACAATTGNGFGAPEGECVAYDADVTLAKGKEWYLAVSDTSGETDGSTEDRVVVKNLDGSQLEIRGDDNEDSELSVNGDATVKLGKITVAVNESTHLRITEEDKSTVEIDPVRAPKHAVVLAVHQTC